MLFMLLNALIKITLDCLDSIGSAMLLNCISF